MYLEKPNDLDRFEKQILQAATEQCGLRRAERVLVGLSGGADSVALLRALIACGFDVVASHCNFGLRGDESRRDELFCRELCEGLGMTLHVREFDVEARRRESGESVEMACRSLRYDWWTELRPDVGAHVLAVAHHLEDNVETFFLNLFRGSGLRGLKAMMPRSGFTVRPMLGVTRADIEAYLLRIGQPFIVDSSNLSTDYRRNLLRLELLPAIERLMPGALAGVDRSIGCLQDNYRLYEHFCSLMPKDDIDVTALAATYGDAAPAALFEMLRPLGFNRSQAADIVRSALGRGDAQASGRIFKSQTGETLQLHEGRLIPCSPEPQELFVEARSLTDIPNLSVTLMTPDEFRATPRRRDTLYLDAAALDTPALWTLRSWRKADRLAPFGMKGTKLVSDIFADASIPVASRHTVPLLFRNDTLLWVAPLRASRHFPVTPTTTLIARISLRE